jgi:hypothetical protein
VHIPAFSETRLSAFRPSLTSQSLNADDASVFFSQHGAEVPQMGDQMRHTTTLSAYLPQNSRGSILVTSRNRNARFRLVGKADRIVTVECMGQADLREGSRGLEHCDDNEAECSGRRHSLSHVRTGPARDPDS